MNETTLIQLLQMAPSRPTEVEERIWAENFKRDYPRPVPYKSEEETEALKLAHKAAHKAYFYANPDKFRQDKPSNESLMRALRYKIHRDPALIAWENWQTECWDLYKRDYPVNWAKAQLALLRS